jgi:hypothetical protein
MAAAPAPTVMSTGFRIVVTSQKPAGFNLHRHTC